jgi:hypothetical protein
MVLGILGLTPLAFAYDFDLAACPDLTPLRTIAPPNRAAARCAKALGRAGTRYVTGALAAHHACLARWQDGEIEGDPYAACVGSVLLATRTHLSPVDTGTAETLSRLRERVRQLADKRCGGVTDVVPYGCEGTDLAACVLADLAEHVGHLLAATHGAVAPVGESPEARRCQGAIAKATRGFLRAVQAATNQCLAREADRANAVTRCVGEVRGGSIVLASHGGTAARIARAERRMQKRLRRRCPASALASLDACGTDDEELAACLLCSHCREVMLLTQATRAGTPQDSATAFVDWATLRNPVLALPDQALKDQALVYGDGWFRLFSSVRFRAGDPGAATEPRWFYRTRDFIDWEPFVGHPELNGPGVGPGSPDVTRLDDTWRMTFQSRPAASTDPDDREIFLSTSTDLDTWTPPVQLTSDLIADAPIIDGALAWDGSRFVLGFKDRVRQTFQVARALGADLAGGFAPPEQAVAGKDDPVAGFAENYQFTKVDDVWRLVATGRDPDPYRCANQIFAIYTCSHEPFIYTLSGPPGEFTSWTRWMRKRWLRVPFEAWNQVMHANTGFLSDRREHDGFFYLSYAGAADGDQFDRRGHGKIGLARSRDLVHWRVPGDLRD